MTPSHVHTPNPRTPSPKFPRYFPGQKLFVKGRMLCLELIVYAGQGGKRREKWESGGYWRLGGGGMERK